MKLNKLTAVFCAAIITASLFTGCSDSDNSENKTDASASVTNGTEITIDSNDDSSVIITTRPLDEGDIYAINKIGNKTEGELLPGGYSLIAKNEENQAKLYKNNYSQIVINAMNYSDSMPELASWADSASAGMIIPNITHYARDTKFEDPENVKVCGFDAIKYDYELIQYKFDENDEKIEVGRYKARIYYFYSDEDAYVINFETTAEDWEEQSKNLDEFVADLVINSDKQ